MIVSASLESLASSLLGCLNIAGVTHIDPLQIQTPLPFSLPRQGRQVPRKSASRLHRIGQARCKEFLPFLPLLTIPLPPRLARFPCQLVKVSFGPKRLQTYHSLSYDVFKAKDHFQNSEPSLITFSKCRFKQLSLKMEDGLPETWTPTT